MGFIFIGALVAVVSGGLLALHGATDRVLNPLRTFAVVAVAATVALHILPEAIDAGGAAVLIAAAVALAAPGVATRIATALRRRREPRPGPTRARRAALELAYIAIVLHKITDGVGLGGVFGPGHDGHVHWEILLGIVAHTIPMAAAVALTFRPDGLRGAWMRVLGLGVAIIAGALLFEGAAQGPLAEATPWLNAVAAGLLLHIIVHDLPPARFTHNGARVAELGAVTLGLMLPLVGADAHQHEVDLQGALSAALGDLALEVAPTLLIGLALGALIHTMSSRLLPKWLSGRSDLGGALRGAVVGAPLPLGSFGVLPAAAALEQRAVAPAAVVAFLLATPALDPLAVAATVELFGWPVAILRVGAALGLAVVAAVVVARAMRCAAKRSAQRAAAHGHAHDHHLDHDHAHGHAHDHAHDHAYSHDHGPGHAPPAAAGFADSAPAPGCAADAVAPVAVGRLDRLLASLDELVEHTGPWVLVGLVAAAYVAVLVPLGALADLPWGAEIALVTLIAIPGYVSALSATPLAAALVLAGLSPGAAFAALLLGPLANVATLGFMRQSFGRLATALGLGAAVVIVWAIAAVVDATGLTIAVRDGALADVADRDHGPYGLGVACLIVLGLLATRTVWRSGLTAWVGALHGHHGAPHPTPDPVAPIDRAV